MLPVHTTVPHPLFISTFLCFKLSLDSSIDIGFSDYSTTAGGIGKH